MKSLIYTFFTLIALSLANPNKTSNHNTRHTFLVKTELTKEQIENLLYQHHLNQTQLTQKTNLHLNENETEEIHSANHETQETQETTQLKAKKQKKQHQNKEQNAEKEVVQEEKPTVDTPVQEEIEPMEQEVEKELNETTNLKGKKDKKQKRDRIHVNEVKEVNETEAKEAENETEALIDVGNTNNNCPEQKTTLIEKNENNHNNIKQSNSSIFNIISVIFLTFAFVSLFIYATQPKKKINNNYYMNQRIKVKV